jgi:hypothetical protein
VCSVYKLDNDVSVFFFENKVNMGNRIKVIHKLAEILVQFNFRTSYSEKLFITQSMALTERVGVAVTL